MSSPAPANCKKFGQAEKLQASAISAALFAVLALPATFGLVDKVFGGKNFIISKAGRPTIPGVLVHAVVFLLIVFLLMEPWKSKNSYKCKKSC